MDIETMLCAFCDAVERRRGEAFAALFTEGRHLSRRLLWCLQGPGRDRHHDRRSLLPHRRRFPLGLPEARGARAMFEGVAIMKLCEGRIAEYREVANTAPAFVAMNFAPERIAKIAARQGAELKARPEMARHLKD